MEQSNNLTIDKIFKISPAYLEKINKFKNFVGADKFELILYGIDNVEIPLESEKFDELMNIVLVEKPEQEITFDQAEEILSFFCKPFAGTLMKRAAFTMNGISSLFQKLDPQVLKTLMESGSFQNKSGMSSDASSLQTETSNRENESINQVHQAGSQD